MADAPVDARTFSPGAYALLIDGLRGLGYQPRGYTNVEPAARHFIMRHDVDFSLAAAVAMAEVEAGLGLSSTYFLLLRTEFYNVLSNAGLEAVRRLSLLGHEIGLHFDAALYPQDAEQLEAAIAHEAGLLQTIAGKKVGVMSFHRPAAERIGERDLWAGRLNAYGARFVRDIGYCSDSRGAWRHGAPLDHLAVKAGRAIQILVHPFWWTAPELPPEERLRRFLAERARFLDQELARNCTVHRPSDKP